MISIDVLLFDLDGTLVDSKRDLADSIHYLQKRYHSPANSQREIAGFIGDGVVKLVQRALPNLSKAELDEAVAVFKNHYREHCVDHTKAYPGVRDMLNHFRAKKMAVVTNKPFRISGRILEALHLNSYFQVIVGGDSLPNKKPHPEPVLSALKSLSHRGSKGAVMVGDSPNDVMSGRAAGIRTCGIRSNIADYKKLSISRPDFIIDHMRELKRLFR